MRIRHAATSLAALGAASACAIGFGLVHYANVERETAASELRSSTWAVQASTDFGTTWTAPISGNGGHFPVRIDTERLRSSPAYQPLTLRTTVGSRAEAEVGISHGVLVDGDPATASAVRIRAVTSRNGTCAAPTFAPDAPSLLQGPATAEHPVDAPTVDEPLHVPAATRTTAGVPVTVCLEVGIDPGAPVADSVLTLAWPIQVTRSDDTA